MKKVLFAASFLLLLALIILVRESTFFTKGTYMLTGKSQNVPTGASKTVTYPAENTEIEILDKTQLLLMNIH